MSVKVTAAVWERSAAEGTDRLVLLALADHADDETWSCWPSLSHLAAKCRISERTVRRSLRDLEAAGEVQTVTRAGTSSRYHIRLNNPGQPVRPGQSDPPDNLTGPDNGVRPTPDNGVRPPRTGRVRGTINEPSEKPSAGSDTRARTIARRFADIRTANQPGIRNPAAYARSIAGRHIAVAQAYIDANPGWTDEAILHDMDRSC